MTVPKLTAILNTDTLALWLGETIQAKAAKENAGLVEIQVKKRGLTIELI